MAATATSVRNNAYVDSVTLLQVSADVQALPGVHEAALVMATELNRDLLRESGLLLGEAASAGINDLVIAIRAEDDAAAQAALEQATTLLATRRLATTQSGTTASTPARSLKAARRAQPDANLAVISVPGPFAASEARQALAEGMHVFLFSDNVPLEDEIELKQRARALGLLVMGPDCGTAIVNGVGLGFANAVSRGTIGLIGASGTGLQEVTTLLDRAGVGVSHALGTGGRDLDERVGGITTLQALALLRDDPATGAVVLVSKTPSAAVAQRVLEAAAHIGKPVIACLLGYAGEAPPGVQLARTLFEAASLTAPGLAANTDNNPPATNTPSFGPGQRQVRGLFCGGTLCEEAEQVLVERRVEYEVIDFGDDRYTRGRAHPMIDPTLRNSAIVEAGDDARVAVLLLDVILGTGSHVDPAGATLPAIREARARAAAQARHLEVVAHVVGTSGDSQGLARQEAALRSAGVRLAASNFHAARAACALVEGVATSVRA